MSPVHAENFLSGTVINEEGEPLEKAKISIWYDWKLVASSLTDDAGFFDIEIDPSMEYNVSVFADESSTPGVDYLPAWFTLDQLLDKDSIITLVPGASLVIEGDIQFVFTDDIPDRFVYSIVEPDTENIIEKNGFPLIYGSYGPAINPYLDLDPNHLVVPANEMFKVNVEAAIPGSKGLEVYSFVASQIPHVSLNKGVLETLEVRVFSINYSLGIVSDLLGEVKVLIEDMDDYGFYTVKEKSATSHAESSISNAVSLLGLGKYVESFDALKISYLQLTQNRKHILNMISDATSSVYVIIVFLALTSTTIAFLLTNKDTIKVSFSVVIYMCLMAILQVTYPGSAIVTLINFIKAGLLSIVASLFFAVIAPRYLKGASRGGMVPLRNIIVPIFSIAKRNIKRRQLRFLLTLISITMLVMSFVTLTSFSETHNLITRKVSRGEAPIKGVLIREPGYSFENPEFLFDKNVSLDWLRRQPESKVVSQKAENLPSISPITRLNGYNIYGVIGIVPELENEVLDLESILDQGHLPSMGGVIISEDLMTQLGVEVGDMLMMEGRDLTLEGVFDDLKLSQLSDIDSLGYLPGKEINVSPPGEPPMYEIVRCETDEIVITHLSTALDLHLVLISRIAITVEKSVDIPSFGERLAIERGYWVWSAYEEGLLVAMMGSYMEGKGLPLIVPWGIVVLNVVATMLNSMHERRKEIHILSSVGLNPTHIATIFMAEASIIGFIGGGLGYMLGIALYKGMSYFNIAIEVEQKISAFWSLASIGIAMTAVLIGAITSIKRSIVITPSLNRRWGITSPVQGFMPWEIEIPVRIQPEMIPNFVLFIMNELEILQDDPDKKTSSIKSFYVNENEVKIEFVYAATHFMAGELYTKNSIIIQHLEGKDVEVKLSSHGERRWSNEAGSLVRMLTLRWSARRRIQ